jgi:hypothetical protein
MSLDLAAAAKIAQDYLRTTAPLKPLGWGIGGFVYLFRPSNLKLEGLPGLEAFDPENPE